MECYNLNILGLNETKMRGNGMKMIDEARCVKARVAEGRARGGVGIIVSEHWSYWLRSWRCMSERCVTRACE